MERTGGHYLRISLRGRDNITYTGHVLLSNLTLLAPRPAEQPYDQRGAGYYVICVVLLYGMSIIMLIASHIKRRHDKFVEDKQIDKYLQDFQVVQERSHRDNYRDLKETVMRRLRWNRPTYRNLQQSVLPLLAFAAPGAMPSHPEHSLVTSPHISTAQPSEPEQHQMTSLEQSPRAEDESDNAMTSVERHTQETRQKSEFSTTEGSDRLAQKIESHHHTVNTLAESVTVSVSDVTADGQLAGDVTGAACTCADRHSAVWVPQGEGVAGAPGVPGSGEREGGVLEMFRRLFTQSAPDSEDHQHAEEPLQVTVL